MPWTGLTRLAACLRCDLIFAPKNKNNPKYCSTRCSNLSRTKFVSRKEIAICTNCNKTWLDYPHNNRRVSKRFCGKDCWFKYVAVDRPENVRQRGSLEYRQWRKDVYSRDNYTCQFCFARGVLLHAHHQKPFAYIPSDRLKLENGVTLCEPCHKAINRKKMKWYQK